MQGPDLLGFFLDFRLTLQGVRMKKFSDHRLKPHELGGTDFVLSGKAFSLPEDMSSFEPLAKRKLTICNLFYGHQQSISDIMRLLDETYQCVILALIENRIILDRRTTEKTFSGTERRRLRIVSPVRTTQTLSGLATRLQRMSDGEQSR